ncbi:putative KH-domain/beta-lactamase-domain protein, archaea [Lupinus albus]|uniref:Putative KH-domain/beta-lactamase-domain protein, archaea n=1 Tax=Lupinus albus TaxID=3870 RepID=A0A6A4MKM4_LUPAL|nr:putative KH-domain/beta-lactamase-domain protein, archaea [Lupinus albus]
MNQASHSQSSPIAVSRSPTRFTAVAGFTAHWPFRDNVLPKVPALLFVPFSSSVATSHSYLLQEARRHMKFTCLSKGGRFHLPPCHMLNFCGIRILMDCPLDLSALVAFSPIPTAFDALPFEESNSTEANDLLDSNVGSEKRQKIEKNLDAKSLIFEEPWYKTIKNLHLWNTSFIDVVLISSPMGILGLPYISRMKGFSAKVYVTEASARLGQLMMEDLVSMHAELRQFYGAEKSGFPPWLRQEELDMLPSVLREIICGREGMESGGWMPLYSATDVKDCIRKVHTLKYAEEACYNGTLVIKAFSSGVEIGSCNWVLNGPKGDITYLSSSSFISAHAMSFDYRSLHGTNALIYSDFSSLCDTQDVEDGDNYSVPTADKLSPMSFQDFDEFNLHSDENLEEKEKLIFISSCAIECVKGGGSVLIPVNRLGTILQLLEEITTSLDASAMKVPVYIISSVAEELLAFLNIIPEWLCKQRQERLFAGELLFAHVKLLKEKRIHVVPAIHVHKLLMNWQEPCIVFCGHWSLRIGPAVHLLRRWCGDPKSLLILEDMLNPELALLPFQPVAMKVLQCVFSSGIGLRKVQPLLQTLQPKTVLFPEDLRLQVNFPSEKSFSVLHYTEAETLKVSCPKNSSELKIAKDLSSQLYRITFKNQQLQICRLKGELFMENSRYHLLPDTDPKHSLSRPLVCCGLPDSEKLLAALSKVGINASLEPISDTESQTVCILHTQDPCKALIEIGTTSAVITTADENVASLIYKVVDTIFGGV